MAEDSANYSFNKSHSIAYATLAAWTTYLKFNYPMEFFLSLLKMTKFEPAPHEEISKIIGTNKAARVTTVKPSGTSSLVLGTSSGIHAWHGDY